MLDVSGFVSFKQCTVMVLGIAHSPPANSKPDPPQDTAEPDSQAGGASGKVHFKRAKCCAAAVRHRSEEKTKCEKQPHKN